MIRRFLWQLEWKRHLITRLRQLQGEYFVARSEISSLKRRVAQVLNTTMPDFVDAAWMASPHFLQGHNGQRPRYIILHTTTTDKTKEVVALDHEKENESVHYLIDQKGAILQTVSELDSAIGTTTLFANAALFWNGANLNGNLDYAAFVIELLTDDGKLSQETLVAAFVLIEDLCSRHRVPREIANEVGGVCGHYQTNPRYAAECGKDFPYSALVDYLNGNAPVPVVEKAPVTEEADAPKKPAKRVKADE